MTTPESIEDGVLALSPPHVLGATPSVVGAHSGVSLLIYDLVIDGKGATVEVDPPLSGTVEPGDVIWLWLLGDTAFLDSEIITDVNAKTRLRIPKGRLHPDRINELFYTITRNSSNIGTSEPNLTLLYNKIRPGLKDRFPEIDGHSELALLLPDAIKNGVGPDFVSAQVCVSYPYCRAYDTITLKCNGEIMTYKVGADEAPQPPNPGSAEPITVCFTVIRDYLERAARPDGKLDFSCTATDQIGNTPDTDAVWSATQRVDEDLAGTRLPAAILLERMEDFPGDDSTRIELDKLDGGPLLVIVVTADNRFLAGDIIEATYTAKIPGQPEDLVVPLNGVIETDPFGQKKPCILQVPNDKVIAESAVTVVYTLKRGDTVIASSATAKAQVIGERTITLTPPVAAANPVDPLAYSQGVEVEVAFAGSLPQDQALLVAVNALPGSLPFSMLPLDPDHRAVFTLNAAFLGLWHGKQPELRWDLIRDGEVIAQSLPLVLTVNRIAHEDPRLSMPVIVGHTGQILEVAKLLATDTLSIKQWLLQTKDIPVWLRFDGTLANGQSDSRIIWSGQIHRFEPSDLVISLTAALVNWLNSLKDDSEVTITFAVNFDKVVDEVAAVRFSVRRYTVKSALDLKPPSIEEAPSNILKPIEADKSLTVVIKQYVGMDPAHKVVVEWKGAVGEGSLVTAPVTVGLVGELKILIDNRVVAFNLGKSVTVRYGIIEGTAEPKWSEPLSLDVLAIPDESPDWPMPTVPQSPDQKVLDLSKFEGDAAVKCIAWPLIRAKQRIWLRCYGTKADSSPYTIELAKGIEISEDEANVGLNKVLLRSELRLLKHDSELRVELKVAFDGATNEEMAVKLEELVLLKKRVPGFEGWENTATNFQIPINVKTEFPSGLIVAIQNAYEAYISLAGGAIPGNGKHVLITGTPANGSGGVARFEFPDLAERVSFLFGGSSSTSNRVNFFNNSGAVIDEYQLYGPPGLEKVSLKPIGIGRCAYFEVYVYDNDQGIIIDDIEWS